MDSARLKILFVVGQLGGGGLERQLVTLIKHLDLTELKVEILVLHPTEAVYVEALQALRLPVSFLKSKGNAWSRFWELRRFVKKCRPDIVHSYSTYTNFPAWLACWGLDVRVVGSLRTSFDYLQDFYGGWRARLNAKFPSIQIYNSRVAKLEAERTSTWKPSHIFVIENGVDMKDYPSGMRTPMADSVFHFLAIGSLIASKRPQDALIVAKQLKNDGYRFVLDWLGDGELRAPLLKQVKEMDLEGCVHFHAYVKEVKPFLQRADALVHFSNKEGSPNAVLEAMAAGLAVLARAAGDVVHLIENEKTGWILEDFSNDAMLEGMKKVMAHRSRLHEMGEAARQKAEKEFSASVLARRTSDLYWDLVE